MSWITGLAGAKPFPAPVGVRKPRRIGPVLVCTHCQVEQPADQFRLNRYQTRESWCADCLRVKKRTWWRENRGARKPDLQQV